MSIALSSRVTDAALKEDAKPDPVSCSCILCVPCLIIHAELHSMFLMIWIVLGFTY